MVALLEGAGLPARFITEHLSHFVVLRTDGQVRGCAGLEVYGDSCLLRSLVVHDDERGRGWGLALVQVLLDRARQLGMREVVVLTAMAVGLVRRFGFVEVEREAIDPQVRASWEFAEAGCCSATCMLLVLRSREC